MTSRKTDCSTGALLMSRESKEGLQYIGWTQFTCGELMEGHEKRFSQDCQAWIDYNLSFEGISKLLKSQIHWSIECVTT